MRRTSLLLLLALCASCTTVPEGQKAAKPATGPPVVQHETVEEHAAQFDEEEPLRLAGSQEELAASAYIVAHLTDAGYVSRLDAVPVQDAVRSTNVVALPPSGEEPQTIVAVAYDSTDSSTPNGYAIAVWMEVARALRAIEPEHSVQFVALGAEHSDVDGGRLGSRRLARQLADQDGSPHVLVVGEVGDTTDPELFAAGPAAAALERIAAPLGFETGAARVAGAAEVFTEAGFETTVFGGAPEGVGPVLLEHLADL